MKKKNWRGIIRVDLRQSLKHLIFIQMTVVLLTVLKRKKNQINLLQDKGPLLAHPGILTLIQIKSKHEKFENTFIDK
jgi:hypothetical protein